MVLEKYNTVLLNEKDNVAVSLDDIPNGARIPITTSSEAVKVEIKEDIKFGHKFAVRNIPKGEKILKYGETIGTAVENIETGRHVHVHNLEGVRGRGDKLAKQW